MILSQIWEIGLSARRAPSAIADAAAAKSDGVLKCTKSDETKILGGYRPDICTGDPPTPGEWALCTTSSERNSVCCSSKYSGGILKCTPISREHSAYSCI
jgi:hypothetical protein